MHSTSTIRSASAVAVLALCLVVVPVTSRAQVTDVGPIDCQVTQVRFAKNPGELRIYCGTSGTFYQVFVSTDSGMALCSTDIGAARGMEAHALAGRLSGQHVALWYFDQTCNMVSHHVLVQVDL